MLQLTNGDMFDLPLVYPHEEFTMFQTSINVISSSLISHLSVRAPVTPMSRRRQCLMHGTTYSEPHGQSMVTLESESRKDMTVHIGSSSSGQNSPTPT